MSEPTQDRSSENAALWAIVEGVESETGDRFFYSLVRHLASALQCQYAFVTELSQARKSFRTLAVWGRGAFIENFEIPPAGTPCEPVLNGQIAHHPEKICQLYPQDTGLAAWNAESYCGVPLLDNSGTVVGHLAIFDDKPMWDGPRGIAVMRIFAARAVAEIERLHAKEAVEASEERLARVIGSALDAIITIDSSLRIELFNRAAEKIFRCTGAEIIGQSFARFMTASLNSIVVAAMGTVTNNVPWAGARLTAHRADGEEFLIEASISRAEVRGRKLFTLILRDVEEQRRAEEERRRLLLQNEYLQEEIKSVLNFEDIVGQSSVFAEVLEKVELVAGTDSSVLVLGETGTGKELIARAIHSHSARRDRPLIKVNCAALPTGLIESELFGHEKGAFTGATERRVGRFELANHGTIFLDEIGEMPRELQVKMLRILQEHEFERVGGEKTTRADVRVIAATNRDLASAVEDGTFRRDLYYRLNVFPLHVPPLRARQDDIPLLAHYFIQRFAMKIGRKISRVPHETMDRLISYRWPGNVRELENVIERAVILSSGPDLEIGTELLPALKNRPRETEAIPATAIERAKSNSDIPAIDGSTSVSLQEVERGHIVAALKRSNWKIDGANGAARSLNLNPSTLRSRMKKLGIRRSASESSQIREI